MGWLKCGKICDCKTWDLPWYKMNTMTPLPHLRKDGVLRIFLTMCDEQNRGRVGYVDVNPDNPGEILNYSKEPVLDIGDVGMFDEAGVLPTSLYQADDKIWLFYSGYQKQVNYPYTILTGIAYSEDDGDSFQRVHKVPILDRRDEELFIRSGAEILKVENGYRMWYSSGDSWFDRGDKDAPNYDIKCIFSEELDVWSGKPTLSIPLKEDEYGLTMPQVFYDNQIYKMIYSVRTLSKGYRLGYAESEDGIVFERKDELLNFDVSRDGFDSEMVCFGKCFKYKNRIYLFYCGNHYGIGGLGWAELEITERRK